MKKILAFVAITTAVVVVAFNLNINTQNDTNKLLTLVNAEALAQGEADVSYPCCVTVPGLCVYNADGVVYIEYGIFYY